MSDATTKALDNAGSARTERSEETRRCVLETRVIGGASVS